MTYVVGVDVGAAFTAAAIGRPQGDGSWCSSALSLDGDRPAMPTVGYFPVAGRSEFGQPASRRAELEPDRVVVDFHCRIGDPVPIVLDDRLLAAEDIAAQAIREVIDRATEIEGGPADRVVVTHPAGWGTYRSGALTSALDRAGITHAHLVSQSVAAAWVCANQVNPGQAIAIYDLGGRSFEATVVRRVGRSEFAMIGGPAGIEELGGRDFDQVVFDHVRASVALPDLDPTDPGTVAGIADLRAGCVRAKERLSGDAVATVVVGLPGHRTRIRLTRSEFECMIRDAVAATVDRLMDAVESAGLRPADLAAVALVGGSSRIPLVAQLLSERFDCPLIAPADPQTAIASGAATHAAHLVTAVADVAASGPPLADRASAIPVAAGAMPEPFPGGAGPHRVAGEKTGERTDLGVVLPARPPAGRHRARESAAPARRRPRRIRLGLLTASAALLVAAGTVIAALVAQPASSSPSADADPIRSSEPGTPEPNRAPARSTSIADSAAPGVGGPTDGRSAGPSGVETRSLASGLPSPAANTAPWTFTTSATTSATDTAGQSSIPGPSSVAGPATHESAEGATSAPSGVADPDTSPAQAAESGPAAAESGSPAGAADVAPEPTTSAGSSETQSATATAEPAADAPADSSTATSGQ